MKSMKTGFTLIELMIALAVIALLAAIALPSYQESVLRGKRAEAKTALLRTMQLQERFYTTRNTYTTTLGDLYGVTGATVGSAENAVSGFYTIAAAADPLGLTQGYTLTATPGNPNGATSGERDFADPKCGNLTLTSTGIKGRSGAEPMQKCW